MVIIAITISSYHTLNGSHVLFHLILRGSLEINVIIPVVQMSRLRYRKVKYIVQITQLGKW